MALTGYQLKGCDLWHAGLATCFMPEERVPLLQESLMSNKDFSLAHMRHNLLYVATDPGEEPSATVMLPNRLKTIDQCFNPQKHNNIASVMRELEKKKVS